MPRHQSSTGAAPRGTATPLEDPPIRQPEERVETEFLAFEFELSDPVGPIEEDEDRLRNVVADFRVFVGEELLYRDVDFPIVELTRALAAWADRVTHTAESFAFHTRSSALRSLIRIARGMEGWYLTSIQRTLPPTPVFSLEHVLDEVRRFVNQVERTVFDVYGFSVLALRPPV